MKKTEEELSRLIKLVALHVVSHPDAVQSDHTEVGGVATIRLLVAQADMPQVVGNKGRLSEALRVFLVAAAKKFGQKCALSIETASPTAVDTAERVT